MSAALELAKRMYKIGNTLVELDGVLTESECQCLIDAANARAEKVGWGEERHENYATQDVKLHHLEDAEATRIFEQLVVAPMKVIIEDQFELPPGSVEADDCFIAKYTVEGQSSLKFHKDGSIVSGIISLSDSADYEGGGTEFRDGAFYRPPKGSTILFGGQREHQGVEVTGGSRYILAMFFRCGDMVRKIDATA